MTKMPSGTLSPRQRRIIDFLRDYLRTHPYPPSVRDICQGTDISSTSVVDHNLDALARMGFLRRDRGISRGIELLAPIHSVGSNASGLPPMHTVDRNMLGVSPIHDVRSDASGDGAMRSRSSDLPLPADDAERAGAKHFASRSTPNVVSLPIVGRIAAGEPIEAVAGEGESLTLTADLAPHNAFVLKVKGKSMIEDLIDDGDLVVVRPQATAENGDIVVALISDGPTGEGQATLKRFYHERDRVRLQPANAEMQPIYVDPAQLSIQGKVIAVIRQLGHQWHGMTAQL
ncbi:MAG: transcriptional repressor LexA [Chloroflexi bacterium]|nr:transcriptional repressor LexA [Chloroflexota bacterium]